MRVAVLSPITWRTPPRQYGPWEQVAANVTEGLLALGVDVTLFATGDSITSGKLASCIEHPTAETQATDAKVNECLHISHLFERASEFDIIHNHFDFLPLSFSKLVNTPVLTTIHGFSSPTIIPVYKKYNAATHYVSISNSNRHPDLDYIATVYNGIDTNAFLFCNQPEDYLLFFGRIHPEKGAHYAIEIAAKSNKKLVIAGLIQDHNYFNEEIQPHIDDKDVVYVGNCGPEQRNQLLGKALALLHPISFEEPFGLSVAEAMCCGTPVIAFNRGSMPELIIPGKTGFLVHTVDEAVVAVDKLNSINRHECRQWVMDSFSKEKMAADYLSVYEQILSV